MGKMGSGGGSSSSKQSSTGESARESEGEEEITPATAPGTSAGSSVSSMAVSHNASMGSDGKRDPWAGRDPRDVASGIKREATNLRYERRGIGRRNDRIQSPDKVRDQKTLDRGEVLGDAKKARHSGNLGHESKKIQRFPRYREGMEPFKQQDGEKLQNPRIENFPTEKNAHGVVSGKKNLPRGYGASKQEYEQ